ncbi:kazal-type serine protease inhibitor domain-containing protein 1 [Hemicordylus capensis]|uniref:kazal-type serine protease inhibitor domain-containing protein 1 n=1 Tax=Hemicordylus capensis TaxID=884348 RepID=UPI00230498A6|nr:kazal-type serine protease inhibitor domain-containing protein 1 [Hemicordylus capensis]XP_053162200.1 kazal-type serine protease inhibitor domain-containing protein 1 [Hemicordylus capensis]
MVTGKSDEWMPSSRGLIRMSQPAHSASFQVTFLLLLLHWDILSWAMPAAPDYLQRGWQRLLEEGESCAECRLEECPTPRGCLSGVVLDACDCCWECANLEGQICDLDNTNHFYGKCGDHLECRLDAGDLRHGEVPEPQCTCLSSQALCGSDGKTYAQICKFQEMQNSYPEANLTVAHKGPCESEPRIMSPPYDIWNITGQDVIFGCEVFAYPMASIEWRKEGLDMLLPGDDPHISVQFRGGPQKYEVTSWLQIQAVRVTDEGTYRCFARNTVGQVAALASLMVLTPDQLNMTKLMLPKMTNLGLDDYVESDESYDYY